MNEDNLNMEIRKFLKKVGITSQRLIESSIHDADTKGKIKRGDEIIIEMTLNIKSLNNENKIHGTIKID